MRSGPAIASERRMKNGPARAASLVALALLITACAADEVAQSRGGDQPGGGPDAPVSLPYSEPFQIRTQLLGPPFHLAGGQQVSVTASGEWQHAFCPVHTYAVTIRDRDSAENLGFRPYLTGEGMHTERWTAPSDGWYRLEVDVTNHLGCAPLSGRATITSP
jgi:hypothetical protein